MNESVLSQLSRLDLARMKSYKELLDFYYGRQWEGKGRFSRWPHPGGRLRYFPKSTPHR